LLVALTNGNFEFFTEHDGLLSALTLQWFHNT
jgi:hypothetical protein